MFLSSKRVVQTTSLCLKTYFGLWPNWRGWGRLNWFLHFFLIEKVAQIVQEGGTPLPKLIFPPNVTVTNIRLIEIDFRAIFSTLLNDQNSIHLFPYQLLFVLRHMPCLPTSANTGYPLINFYPKNHDFLLTKEEIPPLSDFYNKLVTS